MTRIIARLVLAMLLLPFAIVVMAIALATCGAGRGTPSVTGVLAAWGITDLFVVTYWIVIWNPSVRWTSSRILKTIAAIGLGMFGAASGVSALNYVVTIPAGPAMLFGNSLFPLVFVFASVYAWRETPAERFARTARSGIKTVACPICGYNMTGLREARCPECGVAFTLDELLTAQVDIDREDVPES